MTFSASFEAPLADKQYIRLPGIWYMVNKVFIDIDYVLRYGINNIYMIRILCFLLFFIQGVCQEKIITSPPPSTPVRVDTRFYLINFISLNEKEETFTADAYFTFQWQDPRLIYSPEPGETVRAYFDDAAKQKLTQIWSPQIEFLNSGTPIINNAGLFIYPDGRVQHYMSITGTFRTHLDLKGFPFDKQQLKIEVDSFLWDQNVLVFVPTEHEELTSTTSVRKIHDNLDIIKIDESITETKGLQLGKLNQTAEYSTFVVSIFTKRQPRFFVFQVFVPLILVFGISCSVFFALKDPFLDRIMIFLTCLLVFLATKFTINQSLPQVAYMTVIDKAFMFSYLCIGLSVLVAVIEKRIFLTRPERAEKIDALGRWLIPLFFIVGWLYILISSF